MSDCTRIDTDGLEYLEGTLPEPARGELETHLAACETCRDTARAYRLILESYRGTAESDVAPELAARIRAAAREERRRSRTSRRRRLVAAGLVFALALAALFLARGGEDRIGELLSRGDALRAAGDLPRAESVYREALADARGDPRTAGILHRLGALGLARGEFAQALAFLTPLVKGYADYPDRRTALLLRGEVLQALGQRDQAREAYLYAATEFPDSRDEILQRLHALGDELEALGYAGE